MRCLLLALLLSAIAGADTPRFPFEGASSKPLPLGRDTVAWVPSPIGSDFSGCSLALRKFVRCQGDEGVFAFVTDKFRVAWPLVRPQSTARGLKPGDPVLLSVYANSGYGRVSTVKGRRVKVNLVWVNDLETRVAPSDEMIRLSGKPGFGAPVAYRQGRDWRWGQLLHRDGDTAYLLNWMRKPARVKSSDVQVLPVAPFKVGDRVSALAISRFEPAVVTEVLEHGLRYRVKTAHSVGMNAPLNYSQVCTPLPR